MSIDQQTTGRGAPAGLGWLYTNNPFYAVSTVLMLYAVKAAYGELQIGSINCWWMMGVLAAYTTLLAGIAVLIVRHGKVWEDARSIMLLLIVLTLALSISVDDLFVKMSSPEGGTALVLVGFLYSTALMETLLRLIGVQLGMLYRIPYHLIMGLFFLAPWWCSPELHPRPLAELEWTILAFPAVGAGLILTLWPAVRMGKAYAANNGTPWPWPWFPWTAFGILTIALAMRSYALSLTFAPQGPIWVGRGYSIGSINFDTIWAPYFLLPLASVVLLLLLEGGLASGSGRTVRAVLCGIPLLLLLSAPLTTGPVGERFLHEVARRIGSPQWLALCAVGTLYAWGIIRGVEQADWGLAGALAAAAIIGPATLGLPTAPSPRSVPLLLSALWLITSGVLRRSPGRLTAASVLLACGVWQLLPGTVLAEYRLSLIYHLSWGMVILIGFLYSGRWALILRAVGAALVPLSVVWVVTGDTTAPSLGPAKLIYLVAVLAGSYALARWFQSKWFLYGFTATLFLTLYGVLTLGFRSAAQVVGVPAISAAVWSIGSLGLAVLISAHKAHWLPDRLFPRWSNGSASVNKNRPGHVPDA